MGFKSLQIKNVMIEKDKFTGVELILQPARETVTVGLVADSPSLIDTPLGTTIISGDLVRRLPMQ
jgi:hypothetical protein